MLQLKSVFSPKWLSTQGPINWHVGPSLVVSKNLKMQFVKTQNVKTWKRIGWQHAESVFTVWRFAFVVNFILKLPIIYMVPWPVLLWKMVEFTHHDHVCFCRWPVSSVTSCTEINGEPCPMQRKWSTYRKLRRLSRNTRWVIVVQTHRTKRKKKMLPVCLHPAKEKGASAVFCRRLVKGASKVLRYR